MATPWRVPEAEQGNPVDQTSLFEFIIKEAERNRKIRKIKETDYFAGDEDLFEI